MHLSFANDFKHDDLTSGFQLRPREFIRRLAEDGLQTHWELNAQVWLASVALDHGAEHLEVTFPLGHALLRVVMLGSPVCNVALIVVKFEKRSCG